MRYVVLGAALILAIGAGVATFGFPEEANAQKQGAVAEGDAWLVRCNEPENEDGEKGEKACEIFSRSVLAESGETVVEFIIGYPEDKQAAQGVMVLPLGILLPSGVRLQIDDGEAYRIDARFCSQKGCYAFLELPESVIDSMKKGSEAVVTFGALNGQALEVTLPLKGFTRALKESKG